MNLQRVIGLALLLTGPGAAGASSNATSTPFGTSAPAEMHTAASVSMDQAVRMAEQRFHARVVKAETEQENGRIVYVLRLLSDAGRVWTVRVDAASGVLL